VIDEIGEITFSHDVMEKSITVYDNKETAERVLTCLIELLDVVHHVLPTCAADFEVMKAMESIQKDFKPLRDRLSEQHDFNVSARSG
jgi:hypothetical protein